MSIYEREDRYVGLLANKPHTVKELAEKLFISEPTVRRDVSVLQKKELLCCRRGVVSLKTNSPDRRIPLFVRHLEQNEAKAAIAQKAASYIKNGMTVMLDASTTVLHILPFLAEHPNVLVITSGAKTALEAASMGIRTLCTGGEMANESFSYVGCDAERMIERYNADIAFFSCRGVTEDGKATDNSILENNIRRIMIGRAKQNYLLCDKSKLGKTYLNTLCRLEEIDGMITE